MNTDTPVMKTFQAILSLVLIVIVHMEFRTFFSAEGQLEDPEASYEDVADGVYYATSGLNETFVQRLGLSEIRVMAIHINSYSFRHAITKVRQYLRVIFARALLSQVDFITGDFNLFCNRQFSTDQGGSHYGGIALEVLEDVVSTMNVQLKYPITYNVSSSTAVKDVFALMQEGDLNSNLDCMMCISVFYNKHLSDERPRPIVQDRALAHDYIHNVLDRPSQLSNYDVCLKHSDCDWHRPLIVRISSHATRNKRTRSSQSQYNMYERYQERYHRRDTGPYDRWRY